jgi:hypothetical protein
VCKDLAERFYERQEGVRALKIDLWDHLRRRLEDDWDSDKLHNGSSVVMYKKRNPDQLYHLEYTHPGPNDGVTDVMSLGDKNTRYLSGAAAFAFLGTLRSR